MITVGQCTLCEGAKNLTHDRKPARDGDRVHLACPRCWRRGTVPAGFLPADVLVYLPPFTDTFGKTKREAAAALLVLVLAANGNTWRPVPWSEIEAAVVAATAEGAEPSTLRKMIGNPFLSPDLAGLIAMKAVSRAEDGDALSFTEEGIAALAKWVPLPKDLHSVGGPGTESDQGAPVPAEEVP